MTTHTLRPALSSPRADESAHSFSLAALTATTHVTDAPEMRADSSGVINLSALQTGATLEPLSPSLLCPASRLVPEPSAQVLPPPSGAPRWAVATVGLLAGAVAVLATLAVAAPERTTAVRDANPAPSMAAATSAPATTEGDTGDSNSADAPPPSVDLAGAVAVAASADDDASFHGPMPAPEGATEVKATAAKTPSKATQRSKRRSSGTKARKASRPGTATPTPSSPAPKASTKAPAKAPAPSGDGLSVDCILDPSSCGRGGGTKPAAPKAKTVSLPEKLSNTALRRGLAAPKAKAKQCSARHGGAGETVRVKLSIGGSGSVLSATAAAPHANALGRCVADALKTAEFAPFSKPAMGVVYSVRL